MFMNNNAHIIILCEKEQVTKQVELCSMISSYLYILNSYACIYRPNCSGLATLSTGVMDDIYLLLYLFSSFLKFFDGQILFL